MGTRNARSTLPHPSCLLPENSSRNGVHMGFRRVVPHDRLSPRSVGSRFMLLAVLLSAVENSCERCSVFHIDPAVAGAPARTLFLHLTGTGGAQRIANGTTAAVPATKEEQRGRGASEASERARAHEGEPPGKRYPEETDGLAAKSGTPEEQQVEEAGSWYGAASKYDVAGSAVETGDGRLKTTPGTQPRESGHSNRLRRKASSLWKSGTEDQRLLALPENVYRQEEGEKRLAKEEEEEDGKEEAQEDKNRDEDGEEEEEERDEEDGTRNEEEKNEGENERVEGKEKEETQEVDAYQTQKDKRMTTKTFVSLDSLMHKESQDLQKHPSPEHMKPPHSGHPLCLFANAPWCGGNNSAAEHGSHSRLPDLIRQTNALLSSVFSLPFLDNPFHIPLFWGGEPPGSLHPAGMCRFTFTLDRVAPMDTVRLYVIPSERRLGMSAERKVQRSEEGKTFSQVFDTESRLRAVASIAEGCLVSEELVKAGLIGWSYAGKTDSSVEILVAFPSEAHAKELVEQNKLSEDAYKRLVKGEGLKELTPSEKCLLSGRTHTECDQLKAAAGEKHDVAVAVVTEGYAPNEIAVPEFVYS